MKNSNRLPILPTSFGILSLSLIGIAFTLSDPSPAVINGLPTSEHPAVVELINLQSNGKYEDHCTGSLIAPDVILTASHCLCENAAIGHFDPVKHSTTLEVDGLTITNFLSVIPSNTDGCTGGVTGKHDLALVWIPHFPLVDTTIRYNDPFFSKFAAVAPETIATEAPRAGDPIELIGYGGSDYLFGTGAPQLIGAGIKRAGSNLITSIVDGEVIRLEGATQSPSVRFLSTKVAPTGLRSVSAKGDSGGPIFVNGKIAGVDSNGGTFKPSLFKASVGFAMYAPLTESSNREFITEMLKEIDGLRAAEQKRALEQSAPKPEENVDAVETLETSRGN